MSLFNSLLIGGLRFSASGYVLRVGIDSTEENLPFPKVLTTLDTQADYFLSGDGDPNDLLTLLKEAIEDHTSNPTVSVTLTSDFKVQVELLSGGTSIQLLWLHGSTTLEAARFGFLTTTLNTGTLTGDIIPKGIWRPHRHLSEDSRDEQPDVGGVARTINGDVRVTHIADPKKERDIGFQRVHRRYAKIEYAEAVGEPYASFEWLYINSIKLGYGLRVYESESLLGASSYKLYSIREKRQRPRERNRRFKPRWDIRLPLVLEYDPAGAALAQALSLSLDGVDEYANVPNDAALQFSSAFSISFWVKASSYGSFEEIICKWGRNTQNEWRVFLNGTQIALYVASSLTDVGANYAGIAKPTTGVWHHLVFIYSAGTITCYLDGAPKTVSVTGTIPASITSGTADVTLGADKTVPGDAPNQFFAGQLDEIALFSSALDAQGVARLRTAGAQPANLSGQANLVAWWRCGDDDTHPTLRDFAGTNHATLINTEAGDFVSDVP